jgi:hypothetical protein
VRTQDFFGDPQLFQVHALFHILALLAAFLGEKGQILHLHSKIIGTQIYADKKKTKLMKSQKVGTPVKTGVHAIHNCWKTLDSGFRRNDKKRK